MTKLTIIDGAPNEIIMERVFDAPRRLVIKAMMEPELIKRWLGGVRATVVSAEVEARVGGTYRYKFRTHDGYEFQFSGVYRELTEDRAVHSERFDDNPNESLVTTTWVEHDGKTTMRVVVAFETAEVREMVASTGMAEGAGESYDELATLLPSLA